MPPPQRSQGVLRFPLSAILGSEGNVRVLRELFRNGGELGVPLIAKRIGMSRQHVLRTLDGLTELKVVERVGLGRHPSYRVRETFPLHAQLDELFRAEEERYQAILRSIVAAAESSPAVAAVWLYGSVARGQDTQESDVDVTLVVSSSDVERVVGLVRERLQPVEESLGIYVSLVGISPEDVLRISSGDPWWNGVVRDAVTLAGPDPEGFASQLRRARRTDHYTGMNAQ